ncbi:MAG TPA: DUF692 domain-containing protein [Holophagaceae bacterium]|nr:DUF692 domain-containing protein [Holophagaceae bacterium]
MEPHMAFDDPQAAAPFTGVGVGLRRPHLEEVAALASSPVPFWEVAPENVVGQGGTKARQAWTILERDPVISHGLSMSMGGFDAWADETLNDLVAFLKRTKTPWHSEHLCWTSVGGANTHELLPLPFTKAAAAHTADRVKRLQDRLPVPFLLENISWYAELGEAEMSEHDFLNEVFARADCGWLLDINNIYVNSRNHGFDPKAFIEGLPLQRVAQMHIAGHSWDEEDQLIIDSHGAPVIDPVIELFQWVLPKVFEATGKGVPVLLERDNHIPPLEELLAEQKKLQAVYDAALIASAGMRA